MERPRPPIDGCTTGRPVGTKSIDMPAVAIDGGIMSSLLPWLRPTAALPFERQGLHVMAKPIGPICNLDCEYCYYLHKEELYPGTTHWRMPSHTLESYLAQLLAAQPPGTEEVTFAWQGGEPTLLGVEFFQRVVELQQRLAPRSLRIVNTLQTNGTLLNEVWAGFFREHRFLIGLSIDGPAELHDRYRYDKKGRGSFADVLKALHLLRRYEVEFNALVVVHRHNGDHGRRVYTYLRDNGVKFFQFIPLVERRGVGVHAEPLVQLEGSFPGGTAGEQSPLPSASWMSPRDEEAGRFDHLVSSRSVRPEQFGRFLNEVFDAWVDRDVGRVFVQIFDQALAAWLGLEPSLCVFRRRCGRALALEHNGDLYSCDHFVEPEHLLGNIHETPLAVLANSPRQQQFGAAKETTLPRYCRECTVRFACHGECPKNRFIAAPDGEPGLNYLCAGYKLFFQHIDPVMRLMAAELRAGRSAANVMARLRAGRRAASHPAPTGSTPGGVAAERPERGTPAALPRPNDLCRCGSGRKYKRCCGRG